MWWSAKFATFLSVNDYTIPYATAEPTVLGASDDDGVLGVEADSADILRMALEGLHARLVLVVPDLDRPVVGARDEVWLLTALF